jgi:hypothetical protein
MVVDRWPQEFIYISKRLLMERWRQHNAANAKRFQGKVTVKAGIIEPEVGPTPTSEDNAFWLVRKVTHAVKGYTGSFLRPNIYIRGTCEMHYGVVNILQPRYQVAWFASALETPDGPIFVALCGSEHNFLSYAGEHRSPPFKRYASSAEGTVHVIRAARDELTPEEIPPEAEELGRSAVYEAFLISRLRPFEEASVGTVEALFQPIHYEEDIKLAWDNRTYRAGIVGIPLWIATASPKALE